MVHDASAWLCATRAVQESFISVLSGIGGRWQHTLPGMPLQTAATQLLQPAGSTDLLLTAAASLA